MANNFVIKNKIMGRTFFLLLLLLPFLGNAQTNVVGEVKDTLGYFELQPPPHKKISLDGLVVIGKVSPVSYRDDKSVYKVSDMPAAKSGTIADILKTLPSVTQDFNGASLINGVPARFFVDGREISRSELDAYSPSQFEYIEVITNPTSKYDADGLSGIIELRSKKTKQSGLSSAINLSGTHDTQSGSLSLVYNKEKLSISTNISVSNVYQHGAIETITENAHSESDIAADILNVLTNIGAEYSFSEESNLNLSYQFIDFGYNARDFSTAREGVTDMKGLTHQVALTHNYTLETRGERLTTNIYYNQTAPKTISQLNYFTEQFNTDNRNANSSLVAMVDYSLPFTDYATFEAGVKSHTRNININREDDFTGVVVADDYSMNESILGLYMLMNSRMEMVNFQFGIRGESDLLNQNDDIRTWNLFPHLSFDYTNKKNNILKVGYNSRISRPTAADLNPFLMLIDPTSQFQGNPDLKPEYSHNLYADYILKRRDNQMKFSSYYRYVKNLITKDYTNIDGGMILYKPINISQAHLYGANAAATINLWKCFSVAPNIGVEFIKLPSSFASEINSVTTLNAGVNLALQLPHNVNVNSMVRYSSGSFSVGSGSQSAIVQGLAIGVPLLYSELSVNKGLLNNSLNISLRITDPFNVQRNGFMVYSDGTQRESRYLMQTRFIHFGLSYRINNHNFTKRKYDDGGISLF